MDESREEGGTPKKNLSLRSMVNVKRIFRRKKKR